MLKNANEEVEMKQEMKEPKDETFLGHALLVIGRMLFIW